MRNLVCSLSVGLAVSMLVSADVKSDSHRHSDYRPAEYTAVLTCGMGGRGHMNILACFSNTELRLRRNNITNVYKVYDLNQVGVEYQNGFHIEVGNSFEIRAQNSSQHLTLGLEIRDSEGSVLMRDAAGQYGVVGVKN